VAYAACVPYLSQPFRGAHAGKAGRCPKTTPPQNNRTQNPKTHRDPRSLNLNPKPQPSTLTAKS